MTQEELCERAGVSVDAVTRIEGGRRVPNLDTLERIAFALAVEPAALMTRPGDGTDGVADSAAVRISAILDRVPAERREIILQVVRLIAGLAERPAGPGHKPKEKRKTRGPKAGRTRVLRRGG